MTESGKNTALKACSFLFTLISLLHLARGIMDVPVSFGHISIPIWVSFIAFVVAGALAIWCYKLSRK